MGWSFGTCSIYGPSGYIVAAVLPTVVVLTCIRISLHTYIGSFLESWWLTKSYDALDCGVLRLSHDACPFQAEVPEKSDPQNPNERGLVL